MGGTSTSFQPEAPLTQAALADLVAGLTEREGAAPTEPARPVTMAKLDSALVGELGLRADAAAFAGAAKAAGLTPPSRFGSEVVARLLGLRTNHPAGQDAVELLPNDDVTRAEAAFSAAQILGFGDSELHGVNEAAPTFELPELTTWQRRILRVAVSFIGYPYVWGGTSEKAQTPFGVAVPGGFDCSGFVWRVYKLQSYPSGPRLSSALGGRTTMAMSGEVAKTARATTWSPPTSSSSGRAARGRSRRRSTTRASTSGTSGSSTPRDTASRWLDSTAGTRRASRGRGVP
jgi:NlpC/P60 family